VFVCVALVIHCAKRMLRIILSSVASSALPYFSTLFPQRHDFRKKEVIKHKMCVLFSLQLLPETFHIIRKIQRGNIINVHMSSSKVPVILIRFQ
jgi:hypothetical protein